MKLSYDQYVSEDIIDWIERVEALLYSIESFGNERKPFYTHEDKLEHLVYWKDQFAKEADYLRTQMMTTFPEGLFNAVIDRDNHDPIYLGSTN